MDFYFGFVKGARRYAIVSKKLGLKILLMLCHLISLLITRHLTYWPTEGKNHGWFICVCVIGLAADPSLAIAQFPTSQDLNDFTAVDNLTSGQFYASSCSAGRGRKKLQLANLIGVVILPLQGGPPAAFDDPASWVRACASFLSTKWPQKVGPCWISMMQLDSKQWCVNEFHSGGYT